MTQTKSADRAIFYIFTGLLFWLPIPLGSNRPWAVTIICLVTFGLLFWWCILRLRREVTYTLSARKAWLPIALISFSQLWIAFQSWPENTFFRGSIDPEQTFHQLLQGLALLGIFTLTLLLLRSRQRIKIVIYMLIISGIFQAIYGSLMTLSDIEYILYMPKDAYRGVATGTYINRNHLAGYLEMTLAVGIGYMIASLKGTTIRGWREFSRRFLKFLLGPTACVRIGLVIMVAALVMTHSRMGNTAFFVSLTITGVIALILGRNASKATMILLTSLIVVDLVVIGTFFGVDQVIDRIENTSMDSGRRDEVNQHSLHILSDNLISGTGAGSFYGAFPQYRKRDVGHAYYNHAHNDYLQFAIEFGLIGFIPLLAAVVLSFVSALRAQRKRQDSLMRGLSFSAMMSIIAIGIHSTVDFNLQIPANSSTFMVIMALGWMSLYFREEKSNHAR